MANNDQQEIRIVAAALDEWEGGKIILRGVIDPASLRYLQVAPYQREILPESKIKDLANVMVKGDSLPDIEVGLRGQDFQTMPDGTMLLKNAVYIIDGLQRTTAGLMCIDRGLAVPRLGVVVHFSTNEVWERERFRALNLYRTKLSANVILRNMKEESSATAALYHFTEEERTSPLFGRVLWGQRMGGTQLITAVQLFKAAGWINARFGPGRSTNIEQLAGGLDKILANIGRPIFEGNVRRFFNVIDECFGIRRTTFKSGASFLRGTFMRALASVLVDHENFWDGQTLAVKKDMINKIKTFPLHDPSVIQLCSSSGMAWQVLAGMLIKHINSGRRDENRLKPFANPASEVDVDGDEEVEDEQAA
jgi:hypothetical protein